MSMLGISVTDSGNKLFVTDNNYVYEYSVSVAWEVSDANISSIRTGDNFFQLFGIHDLGNRIYLKTAVDTIKQQDLSTTWNTGTGSDAGSFDFSSDIPGIDINKAVFDETNSKVFVCDDTTIYQYTASASIVEVFDGVNISGQINTLYKVMLTLTDDVSLAETLVDRVVLAVVVSEATSVSGQVAVTNTLLSSISDVVGVSESVDYSWFLTLSDSIGASDTVNALVTFVKAVSDSVDVAGALTNILKAIASAEDTMDAADVAIARATFINSIADSIETTVTINVSGVEYFGLVLNTTNMGISTYDTWDFNSFAEIDGKYIGAGRAGVYEIGGDDDDGTDIDWEIDFGSIDFGDSQDKRLPEIFYAARQDGTIIFKVTHVKDDGAKVEDWYQATRTSDALSERRVKLKKGVKSQYYRVQAVGKDGAHIDLEKLELTPVALMRKL